MENIREQEKLEILLKKVKLYLSFSLSFMAISFPIISSLNPISIQEISEIFIIITSNLLLISSLIIFAISIFLSLYAFNGLNSLKVDNKNEITIMGISFYSVFIDLSNILNITGFFLMVLYLSLIFTKNIFFVLCIPVITISSVIVFKLIKKNYLNKKISKGS